MGLITTSTKKVIFVGGFVCLFVITAKLIYESICNYLGLFIFIWVLTSLSALYRPYHDG